MFAGHVHKQTIYALTLNFSLPTYCTSSNLKLIGPALPSLDRPVVIG